VKQGFAGEIVQVLADVDPHAVVAAVANHPGKETHQWITSLQIHQTYAVKYACAPLKGK
jgi:hypothetical protein